MGFFNDKFKIVRKLVKPANRYVEGLFFTRAKEDEGGMDDVVSKIVFAAIIMSLLGAIGFIYVVVQGIRGVYPNAGFDTAWHTSLIIASIGVIAALVILFLYARKNLPEYDKGGARIKRGIFVFLWGLIAYGVVTFVITLLLDVLSVLVVLVFVIALFFGGLAEVFKTKKYKLDNREEVKGNDVLGYHDSHGNLYDRQGNDFTKK